MRILLSIAIILSISTIGFAQQKKDLKGPAAKNAKPWKQEIAANPIVTNDVLQVLQGPAAKNQKPWEYIDNQQTSLVTIGSGKKGLKGPAAKNYKP